CGSAGSRPAVRGARPPPPPAPAPRPDAVLGGARARRFRLERGFPWDPKSGILSHIPCTLRLPMDGAVHAGEGPPADRHGEGLVVLTITNLSPSAAAPAYGTFIASQVESLRAAGAAV